MVHRNSRGSSNVNCTFSFVFQRLLRLYSMRNLTTSRRNKISDIEVRETLSWSGGYHRPTNRLFPIGPVSVTCVSTTNGPFLESLRKGTSNSFSSKVSASGSNSFQHFTPQLWIRKSWSRWYPVFCCLSHLEFARLFVIWLKCFSLVLTGAINRYSWTQWLCI